MGGGGQQPAAAEGEELVRQFVGILFGVLQLELIIPSLNKSVCNGGCNGGGGDSGSSSDCK